MDSISLKPCLLLVVVCKTTKPFGNCNSVASSSVTCVEAPPVAILNKMVITSCSSTPLEKSTMSAVDVTGKSTPQALSPDSVWRKMYTRARLEGRAREAPKLSSCRVSSRFARVHMYFTNSFVSRELKNLEGTSCPPPWLPFCGRLGIA